MNNQKLLPFIVFNTNFSKIEISKAKINIDKEISDAISELDEARQKLDNLIFTRDILHRRGNLLIIPNNL